MQWNGRGQVGRSRPSCLWSSAERLCRVSTVYVSDSRWLWNLALHTMPALLLCLPRAWEPVQREDCPEIMKHIVQWSQRSRWTCSACCQFIQGINSTVKSIELPNQGSFVSFPLPEASNAPKTLKRTSIVSQLTYRRIHSLGSLVCEPKGNKIKTCAEYARLLFKND